MERWKTFCCYFVLLTLILCPPFAFSDAIDDPFDEVPRETDTYEKSKKRKRSNIRRVRKKKSKKRRRRRGLRRKRNRKRRMPTQVEEVVNLDKMDEKKESGYERIRSSEGDGGKFKLFFDVVLNYRPGVNPLSFDNYHTAFLIDYVPKPSIKFSVGIAPPLVTPRFYELDYQISKGVQLRVGRIWIPFDQINPHNTFGGIWNTSILRADNQEAFLPDIWADLGLGFKFTLADTANFLCDLHFYVVNGFQDGGTDPLGESTSYPDFETIPNGADNNTDKSVGSRIHMEVGGVFGLGLSAYSGQYSNEGNSNARILMLGADAQFKLTRYTELRGGYALMTVDLPGGVTRQSYLRGGLYGELIQGLSRNWRITFRGGLMQNDNGVSDRNDRTLVGGRLEWRLSPNFFLIGEHHHDLNRTADKTNDHYSALRLSILL